MSGHIDISAFDTNLGISYSKHASDALGKDLWVVKKAFSYSLDGVGHQKVIVPQGYLTDGASVPRIFWSFFPPWGRYGQAAVLHDWLCEYLGYWDGNNWTKISRKECDNMLNDAMKELGVGKATRVTMVTAVKLHTAISGHTGQTYSARKHEVEKFLLQHYKETGQWL